MTRLSKVRGSWFLEATDFCHPQARQIHRCIFAPVTSVNAHYYSVLPLCIIDFRAKFFIKIQNQASDTSRSLPSFSSAPFLLRAVPSGVSVKAGTPPGTPGTHPEHPELHPEHPEPYPEHPEPHPEHPEPHPEHPEPHPEHPEPHPEHAGIRAMKQRTCFSINSRVSH